MNRTWIWVGTVLVAIVTVVAIGAETRGRGWYGLHGHMGMWGPGRYMAHELNLTETQKKQIKTIWDGERPRVAELVRELASEQADLRTASMEKNSGKVQEIASLEGASMAKLVMEKERMCSEIYASVLDEGQRKKADALQDKISQRLTRIADRLNHGGAHEN